MCLLTDRIDHEVLEAGRDLRIVANIAVGYNNIDVAACRARGIDRDQHARCADQRLRGFHLGADPRHHAAARRGRTPAAPRRVEGLGARSHAGHGARGQALGLVGVGRIGRAVAEKAPAFGMTRGLQRCGVRWICQAPSTCSLDRLLATSDVVSLHCPLTPETRHLIDQKALTKMKRTAYLINTSRGPVVDEAALAWALKQRLIAGAALDVYEKEPEVHADLLAARERDADSAHRQRDDRNADGDGRSRRRRTCWRSSRRAAADAAYDARRSAASATSDEAVSPRLGSRVHAPARARDRRHGASGDREDLRTRTGKIRFSILIGTLLSARTQDATTHAASTRLFRAARTPKAMAALHGRSRSRS